MGRRACELWASRHRQGARLKLARGAAGGVREEPGCDLSTRAGRAQAGWPVRLGDHDAGAREPPTRGRCTRLGSQPQQLAGRRVQSPRRRPVGEQVAGRGGDQRPLRPRHEAVRPPRTVRLLLPLRAAAAVAVPRGRRRALQRRGQRVPGTGSRQRHRAAAAVPASGAPTRGRCCYCSGGAARRAEGAPQWQDPATTAPCRDSACAAATRFRIGALPPRPGTGTTTHDARGVRGRQPHEGRWLASRPLPKPHRALWQLPEAAAAGAERWRWR